MRIACWLPKSTNKRSYCFSNASMAARRYLIVTVHVQYIAGLFLLCLRVHKTDRLLFYGFFQFRFTQKLQLPLPVPFALSIPPFRLLILGLYGRRSVRCVRFSWRTTYYKNLPTFRKKVQMLSAGWMNLGPFTVLVAEGVFEGNKSDLYPPAHRQPPNLDKGRTITSDWFTRNIRRNVWNYTA
jgi:hypothetical protein